MLFIRDFNDYNEIIEEHKENKLLKRFFELDSNGNLDQESNQLLTNLRERLENILPDSNINKFETKWDPTSGVSLKTHQEYLNNFGQTFFKTVIKQTNEFLKENNMKNIELSSFEEEIFQDLFDHATLCEKCALKFYGREDLLAKVIFLVIRLKQNINLFFCINFRFIIT